MSWSVPQCTGTGGSGDHFALATVVKTNLAQGPWFFKVVKTPHGWSGTPPSPEPTTASFTLELDDQFAAVFAENWPCVTPTYPEPYDWDGGCPVPYLFGGGSCWNGVYGPCPDPSFTTYTFTGKLSYVDVPTGALSYFGYDLDLYGQQTPFSGPP